MNDVGTDTLAAQQRAFKALLVAQAPAATTPLLHARAGEAVRFDVYHHAYRARLTQALRSNYPVLHRVLGDDAFAELASGYLADHPSRRPSIRWFGDALPHWLAEHPATLPHPALADLASMEWALGASFDAADMPPLGFADLATLLPEQWPQASFAAHPSVTLLSLHWAVEPIWQAMTEDEHAHSAEPQPLDHRLLVWRQGLATRWRSVEADEARLLTACLSGEGFATLCARAEHSHGDAAAGWVAAALRRWVDDGLLLAGA
jgi:hypothetical protein